MPRGIPGSGPSAGRSKKATGRGKGRSTTLATMAARSGGQSADAGESMNGAASVATTSTGRGRGGKGRASAGTAKRSTRGQSASNGSKRGQSGDNGQQRADGGTEVIEVGGVKIETVTMPGRSGRPQQAEEFPFGALEPAVEDKEAGTITGPSFLIPEEKQPEKVLAAARKRHKGKTFMSRKVDDGVRIWRKT